LIYVLPSIIKAHSLHFELNIIKQATRFQRRRWKIGFLRPKSDRTAKECHFFRPPEH